MKVFHKSDFERAASQAWMRFLEILGFRRKRMDVPDDEVVPFEVSWGIAKAKEVSAQRENWASLADLFKYMNIKNFKGLKGVLAENDYLHLLGVVSQNHNGYLREEATRLFAEYSSNIEAFPYVILRLNDWVQEVRAAAQVSLNKLLENLNPLELIKYKDLIEWLGVVKRRVSLNETRLKILKCIYLSDKKVKVFNWIKSLNNEERLFSWKSVYEVMPYEDFIDFAIEDKYVEVQKICAMILEFNDGFKPRLERLLQAKSPKVRRYALKSIPAEEYANYSDLFKRFLFDKSNAVRAYVKFVLHGIGVSYQEIKEIYQEEYDKHRTESSIGAIAGLAEISESDQLQFFLDNVNHSNYCVRLAVLKGLARLSIPNVESLFLNGLKDRNSRVRNVCIKTLQSGSYRHLQDELAELLKNEVLSTKKAVLQVLMTYHPLISLAQIMETILDSNSDIANYAWICFVSWHHKFGRRLWFSVDEPRYKHIEDLYNKIEKMHIFPPDIAKNEFKDLPHILRSLELKK